MFENDHVIVWNISWLQGDYPVHRHRYDHTGVYYSPGDRVITSVDGEVREVSTPAWNISFQLAGVTHKEAGISVDPLRAVFIQIKRPVTGPTRSRPSATEFPTGEPLERLINTRVRVWEYNQTTTGPEESAHFFNSDTVVVWFDAENQPTANFISGGTTQERVTPAAAVRTFVFEIL
ncbi:MAG: hypothetical protein MI746_12175 [Pseudomonadales bacterium]|nr:hypothetical protein [Pseudomonadales bacterium]